MLVRKCLTKNDTMMKPQPPYSPDVAACDLFVFPKIH
nr:unnamed protein product [Callosobruchus chinensis]